MKVTEEHKALLKERVLKAMDDRKQKILNVKLEKKLLPSPLLKQHQSKRTKNGKTTVMYDFFPITYAIEDAYGFSTRGIYEGIEHAETRRILSEELKFTDEEIEIGYKTAPTTGNLCANAFHDLHGVLRRTRVDELVPYLDHWHWLLDRDFEDFNRGGGPNYFARVDEGEGDDEEPPLYKKIREIYVHELTGRMKNEDEEFIIFEIDW